MLSNIPYDETDHNNIVHIIGLVTGWTLKFIKESKVGKSTLPAANNPFSNFLVSTLNPPALR